MVFDRNALQFYLDHEEETRLEREKFLNGGEVDLSIIPRHVYHSWVRSAGLGVNPYVSDVPIDFLNVTARNTEQFAEIFRSPYRGLDFFTQYFQFDVIFFDRTGHIITEAGRNANSIATEKQVGTTSASIVFAEHTQATCFGYQNYKAPFCRQFCLSAPVFNLRDHFLGVVTIMLDPEHLTQDRYDQAIAILELLQVFYRSSYADQDEAIGIMDLYHQMLPELSDGLVLAGPNSTEGIYNPVALTMLGLGEKADIKTVMCHIKRLKKAAKKPGREKPLSPLTLTVKSNGVGSLYLLKQPHGSKAEPASTAQQESRAKYTFQDLVGMDPTFLRAKREAYVVAPTTAAVMLLGPSGVGKELFAQSIHNASDRKNGPFVAINCGTVSQELLVSELFGYESGAFTGASQKGKIGMMEAASGGTLFLDEIESMPLYHQSALLRSLSSGTIRRVGGVQDIPIDVRIISATKINLLDVSEDASKNWKVRFRPDLYYRLSTCRIDIPALKDHRGDVKILVENLIEKKKKQLNLPRIKASESFLDALYYYDWPGNIRELENVVERAVIFMDPESQVLTRSLLYPELLERSDKRRLEMLRGQETIPIEEDSTLRLEEEITLQRYLLQNNCNVKAAAAALGISRQTLYRKIRASAVLSRLMEEEKSKK